MMPNNYYFVTFSYDFPIEFEICRASELRINKKISLSYAFGKGGKRGFVRLVLSNKKLVIICQEAKTV
jgi:hypothetical protein